MCYAVGGDDAGSGFPPSQPLGIMVVSVCAGLLASLLGVCESRLGSVGSGQVDTV